MSILRRFAVIATLGLITITTPGIAQAGALYSSTGEFDLARHIARSASALAMQYYSLPPWRVFENILTGDSAGWFGDRYVDESLSAVTIVEGNLSSGTWSARGYYYYISAWDNRQYTGWVIFRFRNGYFDCLVYHNFPNTCRRPRG